LAFALVSGVAARRGAAQLSESSAVFSVTSSVQLAQLPEAADPESGVPIEDLRRLAAEAAANRAVPAAPTTEGLKNSLNFLDLLFEGGALMIPIGLMSLLVVAVALERLVALRRGKLMPSGLRKQLRRASQDAGAFVPDELFEACVRYPSAASRILRDMVQKLGRPIPEAEMAISEGTQREADFLYSNVRWLTLAAAVTPLIGLLGTVWGMIIAFYNTTQLGAGTNKAEFLAQGIYVALVTTLGGLAVAIPAAIFAHYFEGRITKMLAKIELELRRLIPRFESYEGKARYEINSRGLIRHDTPTGEIRKRVVAAEKSSVAVSPVHPS
jgi:biopolymer transport protein ExbB